jgi:hypothetical protein
VFSGSGLPDVSPNGAMPQAAHINLKILRNSHWMSLSDCISFSMLYRFNLITKQKMADFVFQK